MVLGELCNYRQSFSGKALVQHLWAKLIGQHATRANRPGQTRGVLAISLGVMVGGLLIGLVAQNRWDRLLIGLSLSVYWRQIVSLYGVFVLYKLTEPDEVNPGVTSDDVTVLLPTIDPKNDWLPKTIVTVSRNRPNRIIVISGGPDVFRETQAALDAIRAEHLQPLVDDGTLPAMPDIVVIDSHKGKRQQLATALPMVRTRITALVDDHVKWGDDFLKYALAPFYRDDRVGLVGTNKRVEHVDYPMRRFGRQVLNTIQILYLERHNYEVCASNAIGGGVFVVSGRTSLLLSSIVTDPDFLFRFTHEMYFFGMLGPLGPDDDNFITRWVVNEKGYNVKFQFSDQTRVETTLGSFDKFRGGLARWGRTTIRSNPKLLRSPSAWRLDVWLMVAVYLTPLFNLKLVLEPLIHLCLWKSSMFGLATTADCWKASAIAFGLMLPFKLVKPIPYLLRQPKRAPAILCAVVFGYVYTFIRLWTWLTFDDGGWSGRKIEPLAAAEQGQANADGHEDPRYVGYDQMDAAWGVPVLRLVVLGYWKLTKRCPIEQRETAQRNRAARAEWRRKFVSIIVSPYQRIRALFVAS